MYVQGYDVEVFDNIIDGTDDLGIFWRRGEGSLYNNTVVNTGSYSFQAATDLVDAVTIYDNLVAEYPTGVGINTSPSGYLDIYNNLEYADIDDAGFVDPANQDYHLERTAEAFRASAPYVKFICDALGVAF